MVGPTRFVSPRWLSLLGGVFLWSLSGCSPKPVSVAVPAASVSSSSAQAGSFSEASAHVRSLPLYRQAEQACQRRQFLHAAALLSRLAAPERAFCQEQRTLCLQDAGVKVTVASVSLPSPPAPATPIHPADADCGPRALYLVCQKLGVSTSVEKLRQLAGTTEKG